MNDFNEIERMTLYEYDIRMLACGLKRLDERNAIHEAAWANQRVKATEERGKKVYPVYKSYKEFFDFEKYEREILGIEEESKFDKTSMDMMRKANL